VKFRIYRTSFYCAPAEPCEEAFQESGLWFVEIATLEELIAFSAKHGDLVFHAEGDTIEIYDDYRE
jgi:hypothetical protein